MNETLDSEMQNLLNSKKQAVKDSDWKTVNDIQQRFFYLGGMERIIGMDKVYEFDNLVKLWENN